MDDLIQAVVEWLQGERVPQKRLNVVAELAKMSQLLPEWPTATTGQWSDAVDQAVKKNLIADRNGYLHLVVTEPPKTDEIQLELF